MIANVVKLFCVQTEEEHLLPLLITFQLKLRVSFLPRSRLLEACSLRIIISKSMKRKMEKINYLGTHYDESSAHTLTLCQHHPTLMGCQKTHHCKFSSTQVAAEQFLFPEEICLWFLIRSSLQRLQLSSRRMQKWNIESQLLEAPITARIANRQRS